MTETWTRRRWSIAWALFCVIYLAALLAFVGASQVYPGDELRFIETSRQFAGGITTELLRTYPEMSGPLPFAIFAQWGRAFGWSLTVMRVLAVSIAFTALLLMWIWTRNSLQSPKLALAACLVVCLNPYTASMSVFLYTDMLSMLFVLAALIAAQRTQAVPLALSLSAALLCRQYLVYMLLAMLAHFWLAKNKHLLAATALSAVPLAALAMIWGGLAPDSWMRPVYLSEPVSYHASYFVGYTGLLFLYMAPLVVARWRSLIPGPRLAIGLAACSLIYWLFPVRPSAVAVTAGISTVGLLDRALAAALPAVAARDVFYWLAFAAGLLVITAILRNWRQASLPVLTLLSFLCLMPFSYLYWEKYFLPALPVAAVAILGTGRCYPKSI